MGSGDQSHAGSFPSGHVEDWRSEADREIRMALAPNTRKVYSKSGCQFNSFRGQAGLRESWPIPVPQLM